MADVKIADLTGINVIPDGYRSPWANPGVQTYYGTYLTVVGYTVTEIDFTDSPYTLLSTDNMLLVDTTLGVVRVNLPDSIKSATAKRKPTIVKVSTDLDNYVNLVPESGTVNGEATHRINNPYESKGVITNDTNWFAISN